MKASMWMDLDFDSLWWLLHAESVYGASEGASWLLLMMIMIDSQLALIGDLLVLVRVFDPYSFIFF